MFTRKSVIALLAACMMLLGFSITESAQAAPSQESVQTVRLNATVGNHSHKFYSCTVDNRRARAEIHYTISNNVFNLGFELKEILWETDWNDHPAFNANAARLDLETNPGFFTEVSPAWAGSASTLDDMPSWYSAIYSNQPLYSFNNTSTPQLRFRFYGVGAGSVGGRCDDLMSVE